MDLFSILNEIDLPGFDDPGYIGKYSSICKKAREYYGLYQFDYKLAKLALEIYDERVIKQYRETKQPVNDKDRVEHLKNAIRIAHNMNA